MSIDDVLLPVGVTVNEENRKPLSIHEQEWEKDGKLMPICVREMLMDQAQKTQDSASHDVLMPTSV